MLLTSQLTCIQQVNWLWQWLCQSRENFPANADIWHLRFHQSTLLPPILRALRIGHYQFAPMQIINKANLLCRKLR